MNISGLMKTTLLDYPSHVASTIFLGGCNFKCSFCHNMNLVSGKDNCSAYTEEEILSFLVKRQGILDGVCITGGEPTLNSDLPNFIKKIKNLGYLVKLDTNGTNPEMLISLINKELIDYVAMDIKSSRSEYIKIAGLENIPYNEKENILKNIDTSKDFLLEEHVDYEFRTTIIEQYHNEKIIDDIGKYIKGAKRYFLQSFVESEYVPDHELCSCDNEQMIRFKEIMSKYINNVELRGVDL